MGETQTVDENAETIAEDMRGQETEIVRCNHFSGRHEFDYKGGCIQAHKLPDSWEFVGFGSRWFAIQEK